MTVSNCRPPGCKPGALPAELTALIGHFLAFATSFQALGNILQISLQPDSNRLMLGAAARGLPSPDRHLPLRNQEDIAMTTMLLIRKPAPLNGVDLALCKRLAQEACRRASAAERWATLIFGRLNRQLRAEVALRPIIARQNA